jgi:hypothetical protein
MAVLGLVCIDFNRVYRSNGLSWVRVRGYTQMAEVTLMDTTTTDDLILLSMLLKRRGRKK